MAQHSYRYQPVMQGGAYWRLDVSWRELSTDDHHFIDEWTAPGYALPEQPSDEYTAYSVGNLLVKMSDEDELIAIDDVELTIGQDAISSAWLDPENYSAELRLWWSADGLTWYPVFWGMVDAESVDPETIAVVEGVWIKRYSVNASDCIRRLNQATINDTALVSDLASNTRDVSATGTHTVRIGSYALRTLTASSVPGSWLHLPPKDSCQPYNSIVKYTYWLTAPAKVCFPEHVFQTPANGHYLFHSLLGTSPMFELGAFQSNSNPLPTAVTAEFYDWWLPYNVLGQGEFAGDWDNLGELVAEMAIGIGCTVCSRHVVETGGQWVRQLWYVPRNSAGAATMEPQGLLLSHSAPGLRVERARVLLTTRTPEGGVRCDDRTAGTGDHEVAFNTHLRTMDVLDTTNNYDWADADANKKRNTFWQTLIIPGSGNYMQVANYARISGTMAYYPMSQLGTWANRAYNGYAEMLANWYSDRVYSAATKIEEEYSRAQVEVSSVAHPGNWVPGHKLGDQEDTGGEYRLLEAEIDAENNRVKIVKEKIA